VADRRIRHQDPLREERVFALLLKRKSKGLKPRRKEFAAIAFFRVYEIRTSLGDLQKWNKPKVVAI